MSINEGATGDDVLELTLRDDLDLDDYELIEEGKLTPVIDRTYPLNEVPEAIRYLEKGHARGKVAVTV